MGECSIHFRIFVAAVSQFFPSMPPTFCYYLCKNFSNFTYQQLLFLDDIANDNIKQTGLGTCHIIATFEAMKCVKEVQETATNSDSAVFCAWLQNKWPAAEHAWFLGNMFKQYAKANDDSIDFTKKEI